MRFVLQHGDLLFYAFTHVECTRDDCAYTERTDKSFMPITLKHVSSLWVSSRVEQLHNPPDIYNSIPSRFPFPLQSFNPHLFNPFVQTTLLIHTTLISTPLQISYANNPQPTKPTLHTPPPHPTIPTPNPRVTINNAHLFSFRRCGISSRHFRFCSSDDIAATIDCSSSTFTWFASWSCVASFWCIFCKHL
jgi:hypothetical protein